MIYYKREILIGGIEVLFGIVFHLSSMALKAAKGSRRPPVPSMAISDDVGLDTDKRLEWTERSMIKVHLANHVGVSKLTSSQNPVSGITATDVPTTPTTKCK